MTDLDTLRRALRASRATGAAPEPAFDPAAIITRGRRLRWRRRAAAAGGGLCLGVAVFGAVAGVGRLTAPSPGPGHHPISPAGPAGAGAGASTRPRPVPSPVRDGRRAVASGQRVTHRDPDDARHQPGNADARRATAPTPRRRRPRRRRPSPSASPAAPMAARRPPSASATTASVDQPSATPTATQ